MCIRRGLHPLEPPLLFFGGGPMGRHPPLLRLGLFELGYLFIEPTQFNFIDQGALPLQPRLERMRKNTKKVKSGAVSEWLRRWT